MGTLVQDLRYGLRILRKNLGLTAVAVLTLALGIGANTAVFSVINAVLLRPLPYADSHRLVQLWETNVRASTAGNWVSYPNFLDWRAQNQVFEDLAAYRYWLFNITGGDYPEAFLGLYVSHNLFSVLRATPRLGRTFLSEEDQPGRSRVVILSCGLWQRRFGSDPGLIGRTIMINSQSHTVVGIMPAGFNFPPSIPGTMPLSHRQIDLWIPLGLDPKQESRGSHNYWAIGRLKSGVAIQQAQAEMDDVGRRLAEQYPNTNRNMGVEARSLRQYVAKDVRPALLILLGAIGLVLAIACVNIANLLLARAVTRQKETAIRTALGAGRRRLVRQWLTESMLLALLGGAAGLLLAVWIIELLRTLGPQNIPRLQETAIDLRVLGFTLAVSLVTGALFGLAPALQGSRVNLNEALKESGTRSTAGLGHRYLRSLLVVSEMALALMLLISAGLLIRSFLRLQQADPGFRSKNVLTAWVMLPPSKYAEARRQAAFFKEVIERIEALPGVESAAAVNVFPLTGTYDNRGFDIEGRPAPLPGEPHPNAEQRLITPDCFRTMGISLLKGRAFTWQDAEGAPEVAIISDTTAQRYWPSEDPVGKRLSINRRNGQPVWRQIVGVVKGVRHATLEALPYPEIYVPLLQRPSPFMILATRTRSHPAGLVAALRREVMAVDKEQPIFNTQTMEQLVSAAVSRRRFQMLLLVLFAATAMALAAVGVYGVIAYSVTQRTHEIGVRMALGAEPRAVLTLVVGQGLKLALMGMAAGLAAAFALTRVLSSLLYGISATDPPTFIGVSLLLVGVALLASYIPARRAMRIDPMAALRYE